MNYGVITKKLANKFWVKSNNGVCVCEAMGNLKKENLFVGDKVFFENNCIINNN